jgi:hypothetical protein
VLGSTIDSSDWIYSSNWICSEQHKSGMVTIVSVIQNGHQAWAAISNDRLFNLDAGLKRKEQNTSTKCKVPFK